MKILRILLLGLIAGTLPATTLANAVHATRCAPGVPTAHVATGDHGAHAGHDLRGDSGVIAPQAADDAGTRAAAGCECGCNCAGVAHCGATAGISVDPRAAALPCVAALATVRGEDSVRAVAGHAHDLLRPPSRH